MTRLALLLAFLAPLSHGSMVTIQMDNSTSLLDGSMFSSGTTYYAAFELSGSDNVNSQAWLTGFSLDGGLGLNSSGGDFVTGIFAVGPDSSDSAGIWQSGGTLGLQITEDPSAPETASFSAYTQQLVAGSGFEFTVDLSGVYLSGIPDAFTFQLYDSGLSTLLYQQELDQTSTTVPEPSTAWLCAPIALVGIWRRRAIGQAWRSGRL
jgi:hypothetical protein